MQYYYHLDNLYLKNPLIFRGIAVAQIGRMFCKRDTVIKEHFHTDLFELTVVNDGKGTISTNGIQKSVKKGDIHLSIPGDTHKIESDWDEPLRYDFFAFRLTRPPFDEAFGKLSENLSPGEDRVFSDERIQDLISRAIGEISSRLPFSKELLSSIFEEVIIYTLRGTDKKEKEPLSDKSHREILCYSLMNYIDTHLHTMHSLKELEKVTDYSYGYLSSVFKKTTSESLQDYYRKKKLSAAAKLLKEKKLSVAKISERFNYSSPYAFSKAFKNEFGISPTEYRK
ncbi:MAG: helix-turn-helix domain-containing protein [Clostridia bacterium]|nr:helix-turn-helix domain-containing protein [Clostridia bacterium]